MQNGHRFSNARSQGRSVGREEREKGKRRQRPRESLRKDVARPSDCTKRQNDTQIQPIEWRKTNLYGLLTIPSNRHSALKPSTASAVFTNRTIARKLCTRISNQVIIPTVDRVAAAAATPYPLNSQLYISSQRATLALAENCVLVCFLVASILRLSPLTHSSVINLAPPPTPLILFPIPAPPRRRKGRG